MAGALRAAPEAVLWPGHGCTHVWPCIPIEKLLADKYSQVFCMWSLKSCYLMLFVVGTLKKAVMYLRTVNSSGTGEFLVFSPSFAFSLQISTCIALHPLSKALVLPRSNYEGKKKNRNYLSSSYLFRVLENRADNELTIICNPLSVNFSINWAQGLLTNKIYYSSENPLFKASDLPSISLVIAIKLSWELIYAIVFSL